MELKDLISALKQAPRSGSKVDIPQGSRYVAISETALEHILLWLEATDIIIEELETLDKEYRGMSPDRILN